MQVMNDKELAAVSGGLAQVCTAEAFAGEAFAAGLGGAVVGAFVGGAPGAGLGFLTGVIGGNVSQLGRCVYSLVND